MGRDQLAAELNKKQIAEEGLFVTRIIIIIIRLKTKTNARTYTHSERGNHP